MKNMKKTYRNYWVIPAINQPIITYKLNMLCEKVCNIYNITEAQLKGINRRRDIVVPRQLMCYIMRRNFKMGYSAIATYFNKNHATIIHAERSIENLTSYDKVLKEELNTLYRII